MKITFNQMLENIKSAMGFTRDVEVANMLGISPTAFSQQKTRNSIPHSEVIQFCVENGYSLDVFYGAKPQSADLHIKESEINNNTIILNSIEMRLRRKINSYFNNFNHELILMHRAFENQNTKKCSRKILIIFLKTLKIESLSKYHRDNSIDFLRELTDIEISAICKNFEVFKNMLFNLSNNLPCQNNSKEGY